MSQPDSASQDRRDIHCPRCSYRPRPEDRWSCMPSCGATFHTFWTGGLCPGCGYAWQQTQCPSCSRLSPHRAWYHDPVAAKGEGSVEVQELQASYDK
ncbi:MAG: hypothetical protein EPO01_00865 [Aquabacterium sp.]|jgi:hypothetical protein|nr:MAG: hypothetical protein EPO01_00865 [Aquabacterium sp.]